MIRLREDVAAWSQVGDESVVLDLAGSRYLTLNDTATTLWSLLSRGTSEKDMVAQLTSEYEVDGAAAGAAVTMFLDDLRKREYLSEDE